MCVWGDEMGWDGEITVGTSIPEARDIVRSTVFISWTVLERPGRVVYDCGASYTYILGYHTAFKRPS